MDAQYLTLVMLGDEAVTYSTSLSPSAPFAMLALAHCSRNAPLSASLTLSALASTAATSAPSSTNTALS